MANLYDLERLFELDQQERQTRQDYGRAQVTPRSRVRSRVRRLTLVNTVLSVFRLM
ncbi:MAG: hypothetical protein U0841_32350 [Chloroflexia bacterium]